MEHSQNQGSPEMNPTPQLRVILPSQDGSSGRMELPAYLDLANTHDIQPPQADFSAPPPYDIATQSKLPTYEEVQREKQLEADPTLVLPPIPPQDLPTYAAYVTVERPGNSLESSSDSIHPDHNLLGTDIMFLTSFFVAFLFNWIGFLLLMCFCHTVASRYGALAGFGLSLAKWTLIVKHSTELASHENSWLWWLIMAFGIIICVRAIIQYFNIKRGWRLLTETAQERLLFF